MRIGIFADDEVGRKTVEYVLDNHPEHLKFLVVNGEDSAVREAALSKGFSAETIFKSACLYDGNFIDYMRDAEVDYIVLAWWPHIVKTPLFEIPRNGILNFHPSFLPHNRGKHYNFWTLVEGTPFGVTIHFIDEGVDTGDIVFQKEIPKTWEDTGETLYHRAQKAMLDLFMESYPALVKGDLPRVAQDLSQGSFHRAAEIDPACIIDLDKEHSARDLLNLLRARTFPPHPGCVFRDASGTYEIQINIQKKRDD